MRVISHFSSVFQSTLPARGATRWTIKNTRLEKFQSTLPARGATVLRKEAILSDDISIHAPRTGSDDKSS